MSTSIYSARLRPATTRLAVRPWFVAGGFVLLSLLLRSGTFARSLIDPDEGLFMLLGRSVLRGEMPYTGVFEHSPLGSYALFAAIQVLFGPSVVALRIVTALIVGLTCFLVYRLARRLSDDSEIAGVIAGLLYAVFTVVNLGLAAHRELYLAPLVTFAFLMVLAPKGAPSAWRLLAAGIAMGCALQIKFMYAFEWLAVALAATIVIVTERRDAAEQGRGLLSRLPWPQLLRAYFLLAAPALLLLAGEGALFALAGHWADFAFANFQSAAAYVTDQGYTLGYLLRKLLWQTRSNSLIWLGAAIAPFYPGRRGSPVWWREMAVVAWFFLALLGTASTGRYWDHYYLQLVAPGSVLIAVVLGALVRALGGALPGGTRPGRRAASFVLVLVALSPLYAVAYGSLVDSASLARTYLQRREPSPDGPLLVSESLKGLLQPGDTLWVADYESVVYYLAGVQPPTRYVQWYLTDEVFGLEGIPQMAEFQRVMGERPTYIVLQNPPSEEMTNRAMGEELAAALRRDYLLVVEVPVRETVAAREISVEIYRRR